MQVAKAAPALASDLTWYDGGKSGAYSSQYEVKLLALALVNYGESIVDDKETGMSLMQWVETNSIGYPGHNAPWQPLMTRIREGLGILDHVKDMPSAAKSAAVNGKYLLLFVPAASSHLALIKSSVGCYRGRLLAGAHLSPRSRSTCL